MNKKLFSTGSLIVAAVLLIAVNVLANISLKSARIDLTGNKLYTLSQGTKNIVKNLDEKITLRLYFSENLAVNVPKLMNYGRRVRDMLEEYAAISNGNIKLIVTDPEPFSDAEDQAVQYGLQGVPVDAAGSLAYFGLVGTNETDDQEIIKFFQPDKEESLEYDVTKLVYTLANPKKKTVGLMSSLDMEGAAQSPFMPRQNASQGWMIINQLKQAFNVRKVEMKAEKIPDDIDVLMLVHPKDLSDKTLYAIDQFVLKGGRTIVFVDPNSEADTPKVNPQNPMAAMTANRSSNLKKLFDKWGIELGKGKIATDINAATRVTLSGGLRPEAVEYVAWLSLKQDNFNQQDFVTSDLKQINMATAGYLKKIDGADTEMTPLMETSDQAMPVDTNRVKFGPNPKALLDNYVAGAEKLILAARISGKVTTAFPDGPPAAEGEKNKVEDSGFINESKEPINAIVVGDTDMLSDKFWVNVQNFFGQRIAFPRANNAVFVMNAIDNLGGNNDLISLRSRGKFARPFEKVKEIQREAERQYRDKEKALQAKLKNTEQKINNLQRQKAGKNALIISPEQQREIEKFRNEQVKTRKELRNVQHELRKNIESLGATLKFINIGLMPILIIILALALEVYRLRRLRS
jgi:ABC-type uncharacterized transport system involved in gliding motility auxiliary subunit